MNVSEVLNILETFSTIFYKIVDISIKASVVGIIGLFLIKVLKTKISPKHEYLICLIFILVLIVPIKISYKYNISIYIPIKIINDFADNYLTSQDIENYFINYNSYCVLEDNSNFQNVQEIYTSKLFIKYIISVIFLLIILVKGIIFIVINFNFKKKIKNKNSKDERFLNILKFYKKKLNIKRKINISISENIEVPSIFGIIHVRLLLPKSVYELTDREIEYIICHELYHYKRKDNVMLPIISILEIIYIFNPIVLIVLREVKNSMEYAVDEKVMLLFDSKGDKINYCSTLLKMASDSFSFDECVNCFSSKTIMLYRIRRVKNERENYKLKYTFIILGIVLIIGFAVYTVSENMNLYDCENIIFNEVLNKNCVKVSFEYIDKSINNFVYESNSSYISTKYSNNIFHIIFKDIDEKDLYYKYLRNEIYNSKECSIISIYSKTLNSFIAKDLWIDIENGEVLKEETYYNIENEIKPNNPICIIEYNYIDELP